MNKTRVAAAMLAAVALGPTAVAEEAPLPTAVMANGGRTARCSEPMNSDGVIGTTSLGGGRSLVEVRCWTAAYQSGSIFFVFRKGAAKQARLLRFQEPVKEGFTTSFSLSDAELDAKTRIMRSFAKGRGAGDCGTIGEWKWTGNDFKLAHYWSKPDRDGEPFDDDAKWQVFPPKELAGQLDRCSSAAKWPRHCSQASSSRLGIPASTQIAKNSGQPALSAMKPAPSDR
jgi:hypothetical protein